MASNAPRRRALWASLSALLLLAVLHTPARVWERRAAPLPAHASDALALCAALNDVPVPPADARARRVSDRFDAGTKAQLIRNATIWTGGDDGREVVVGDILLDKGLIKAVGAVSQAALDELEELVVVDAHGAWVTPGIVDLHSHMGNGASPALRGAGDSNSHKGPILPWMRAIDGLNTHDDAYALSVAGGITTALILPGSANAIAGEAYTIKLRHTRERTPTSLLVDAPPQLNGTRGASLKWRHMKHACGENPRGAYGDTRMDTVWKVRQAYDKARQIKEAQDAYCGHALAGQWDHLGASSFPEDLQWEPLVAILRGQVKGVSAQVHCYEETDITNFVRITNEFKFPVAAFHHAHEAYLVPDVLRQTYGGAPAIAMFAAFSRYKREGWRHSQYAPRILADAGIPVVMKSDHPAISRTLLHEAQQAHFHGLPDHLALSSVTIVSAKTAGLDWRLGFVKKSYDADIVIWDSHPLALGATPKQVFIDGEPQLKGSFITLKPASSQAAPETPNFDKDAALAIEHEGLPPLEPATSVSGDVLFINVAAVWVKHHGHDAVGISEGDLRVVGVRNGQIACIGPRRNCSDALSADAAVVDLDGGDLTTGIVASSAALGLAEIALEPSTTDGVVADPLLANVPQILGGEQSLIRAVDGLQFGTRNALLAYRAGVVASVSAPVSSGMLSGLSTAIALGSTLGSEDGAVIQDVTALHISVGPNAPYSVSTQVAVLRRLLLHPVGGENGRSFQKVTKGAIPLVINVDSADVMATLIRLKAEVERASGARIRMTFVGGAEAHLLADTLADAQIGVILTPPRSFPYTWSHRRILPGPPLSAESVVTHLFRHNVTVGLAPEGVSGSIEPLKAWAAQNLRWDAGWAALESNGTISYEDAIQLVSGNVATLLGLDNYEPDLVATKGGRLLGFESRVVGVVSARRGVVDLF